MNRKILIRLLACVLVMAFTAGNMILWADSSSSEDVPEPINQGTQPEDDYNIITISAAGDITLGSDADSSYVNSFDYEFNLHEGDFSYFMQNVKSIFENDDLTIANLEAPFTTATTKAEKQFRFKANPEYTAILKLGSIEAVNLANNHMYDYLERGCKDTLLHLSNAQIGYFGFQHKYLTEVKGIKIGLLGYTGWDNSSQKKAEIRKAVEGLKTDGAQIIIVSFHWGEEREYKPNTVQKDLGHFCIDIGCDLVLGHHPHVIQGIEKYKGKNIVYSLGNFCFGGNRNPSDKDAYIYQHSFRFFSGVLDAEEGQVIPVSVSSVSSRNNYQPTPLTGAERDRVMKKIQKYSMEL
ncbi:MAG: CapA family protein [Clostridia bacterium]|jgi:poly-gamma-glutamate synthesis protein (capsule biosynthesis protein)|nr:CapA family protein [Clostridia bacterium]